MNDYTRVTFREPIQSLNGERSIKASTEAPFSVVLRKAVDPRRLGEGVEVVLSSNGKETVEFISLELVSSLVFAPVKGTAPVAAGTTHDAGGASATPNSKAAK